MTYCIVIPIYKEQLSDTEQLSLISLYKKTNGYNHTYLVCPKGMNISKYKNIYPNIHTIEFDKSFFENIYTYSQLCVSYNFYNLFGIYDYMIIYQLDTYLFKDNLKDWVNMGYDYIGAPAYAKGPILTNIKDPYLYNGGFSIRKIKTFRYLTDPNSKFRILNTLSDDEISKIKYEDMYFTNIIPNTYGFKLNLPKWNIAIQFSFDIPNSSEEHVKNFTKQIISSIPLPTGCHGFSKHKEYLDFFKQYINEFNN